MDRRQFIKGMGMLAVSPYVPQLFQIQPLERKSVDPRTLELVRDAVNGAYGGIILTRDPLPLPQEAYYEPRNRYRTLPTWKYLQRLGLSGIIIGITDADISQPNGKHEDWGVMGVGTGGIALLSTYRIRQNFEHRLKVVVTHEIGHALGKDHCAQQDCTMRDLEGDASRLDAVIYGHFCSRH